MQCFHLIDPFIPKEQSCKYFNTDSLNTFAVKFMSKTKLKINVMLTNSNVNFLFVVIIVKCVFLKAAVCWYQFVQQQVDLFFPPSIKMITIQKFVHQ